MSDSAGQAVFLSYASQDVEAAKRISEALRTAGVEVWLDQSELTGGDAWDQKIRGQVATCVLFLPIVSANTQARREGYFRLEWKLADERTHLMAEGTPFLLPVVIDDTKDRDALVPKSFLGVQWTRLPAGETTAAFVTRVQTLLGGRDAPSAPAGPLPRPVPVVGPGPKTGLSHWMGAVLGVVVLGLVALIVIRPAGRDAAPASPPVAEPKPLAAPVPVVNDKSAPVDKSAGSNKSIAVLPFANRSPDKENEFFTDGVHEDILTNLFNIRALRVVSRTSVEQYRGTKKSLKEIGLELGVAYILEGSVQRVGNKVRVTAKLNDARSDTVLRAMPPFERDLSDVFTIQAEIAKAIAAELQTVLSPDEQKLLEHRPTENVAAYDLYLKARAMLMRSKVHRATRERLLLSAVGHDPNFALAWSELAITRAWRNLPTESAGGGEEALARAVQLAPDAPSTHLARGWFTFRARRDYTQALGEFEKVIQLQPSNAGAIWGLATVQKQQGRWQESLANHRRALQLDPVGADLAIDFAFLLAAFRRWDDMREVRQRMNALRPVEQVDMLIQDRAYFAEAMFSATGSTQVADDWLAGLPPGTIESSRILGVRKWLAQIRGDHTEWLRLDVLRGTVRNANGTVAGETAKSATLAAMIIALQGDPAGARQRLAKAHQALQSRLEANPNSAEGLGEFALMEAVLGQKLEAVRDATKAVELLPEARDIVEARRLQRKRAAVYAWTGEKERALDELARLLRIPFGYEWSVHDLAFDPAFAPLRGHPRFEALLKDPKYHQPLF